MLKTQEEIKQLALDHKLAREEAIKASKRFKIIKTVFYLTETDYDNKIRAYNRIDKEYAFALFDKKQAKIKKAKKTRPYDANKILTAKALKALKSLPEEIRVKILSDVQEGLF